MSPECAVCSTRTKKRCAKCRVVPFCSPQHQVLLWPSHKYLCGKPLDTFDQPPLTRLESDRNAQDPRSVTARIRREWKSLPIPPNTAPPQTYAGHKRLTIPSRDPLEVLWTPIEALNAESASYPSQRKYIWSRHTPGHCGKKNPDEIPLGLRAFARVTCVQLAAQWDEDECEFDPETEELSRFLRQALVVYTLSEGVEQGIEGWEERWVELAVERTRGIARSVGEGDGEGGVQVVAALGRFEKEEKHRRKLSARRLKHA